MLKAIFKIVYYIVIFWFLNIFFIGFDTIKISPDLIDKNLSSKLVVFQPESSMKNISPLESSIPKPTPTPTPSSSKTSQYINFPVSKTNSLGNFAPDDLVSLSPNLTTRSIRVSKLIVSDLEKLITSAKVDGITLKVVSGYRSYSDQNFIFNNYVNNELKSNPALTYEQAVAKANTYSAKPGHSEHQLGTTIDILSSNSNYQFDSNPNSHYAKWLESNASRFNFSISYPQNNPEYIYEPWHIRWRP